MSPDAPVGLDRMEGAEIEGWLSLTEWFGYSPDFHDAELVGVDLRREPEASTVSVQAWRTNADVDEYGFSRLDRHAIVTFTIGGIKSLRLNGWNHQNVIWELWVTGVEGDYTLHMPGCYGAGGEIHAATIAVSLEPKEI